MTETSQRPNVNGGLPVLTGLLFATMTAGTFTIVALGIVASFVIDDLGITRAQLGLVISADILIGAVASPFAGRLVDRIGGKRATIVVFVLAALGLVVYGLAPVYGLLFAGALLGGVSDAACNPATNRLIAECIAPGSRGVITGIKQSGVQAGVFLGGLTLPSMAVAMGWRPTYLIVSFLPLLMAFATGMIVHAPPPSQSRTAETGPRVRLPSSIWWMSGYGLLFGFAGAVTFLIPLFVEESVGLDARIGGLAVAVVGLVAVGGRIWWARLSEARNVFIEPLWAMTPLAVAGGLAFLAAGTFPWLIWPGAVLLGLSTSSWNSVAMLAVMSEAGTAATGRASGIVVGGFLLGLGIGPAVYGALVDATGDYVLFWWASIAAAAATAILVGAWRVQAGHRISAERGAA